MANWFLECDDGKFYISDYAESCVGNANTVIRKEQKKYASFALGRNPECCHFYHGKMEPYIKVQSTGLGIWKAENLDENSRRGVKWETGVLTWTSDHWKMEIPDFLYSPPIVSYILDIFPL